MRPLDLSTEKNAPRAKEAFSLTLTNLLLFLCVILFFWNGAQEVKIAEEKGSLALELGFTPLEQKMIFDYPYALQKIAQAIQSFPPENVTDLKSLPKNERDLIKKAEAIPSWKGVYEYLISLNKGTKEAAAPLFEKIGQGELWRLVTPIFIHRGFLHILFNMAWLWILGRQIEERIGKWRMILLIAISATISNVAQYFMSGPFFLGFSGVVVAMAGFIWMRQKLAPWEGYPLQRAVLLFVLIFVLAMFALEIFSFALKLFTSSPLTANIANTAHIVGGLVGMTLARAPYFARHK